MTVLLRQKLEKILRGNGVARDLGDLEAWPAVMAANRCGLGQTAHNPIRTALQNFRPLFENLIRKDTDFVSEFDLSSAVAESCLATGRKPAREGPQ
jgi:[NiFe] hydrogenase diaphorase moiety large subunit